MSFSKMKILVSKQDQAVIGDPSEFRPDLDYDPRKSTEDFRNFVTDVSDVVKATYANMRKYQTVDYVKGKIEEWGQLNHAEMSILEAVYLLDDLVDESDPDISLPNSIHAFQTAERIREVHPDKEWFILVGLIHDLGKVMGLWGEPQWSVVGDTFPVGCQHSKACVLSELFEPNPDSKDPRYNTKLGMYEENCGLSNVLMSWGHDEYMYRVLKGNGIELPEQAFYMIRFHSFYPWHTSGAYQHLASEKDKEMLPWIREFNKFDLYSKADNPPDPKKLEGYYQSLIDKYIPGSIKW